MAKSDETQGAKASLEPGIQEIDGECGIASITGERNAALSDKHKKIIVGVMLVFLGALAYLQWPRAEQPVEEAEQAKPATRIRPAQNFEPADIGDVAPPPAPAELASEAAASKPSGPIERARAAAAQEASAQTEAEQILESSKRAPLMAYTGNQTEGAGSQVSITESPTAKDGFSGGGSDDASQNRGLSAELVTGNRSAVKASILAHPHLTITEGTIIPCALETAMDSTAPGIVRCSVTDDVYSTTGAVILLDRGTRIVGEYRGGVQRGRKRMFVTWTRAETPSGVIVNLSSPAADSLGRSGVTGDLDTQFWTRFGGTMMLSVIDAALVELADSNDDSSNSSNNLSELAQTELDQMIDVPVILRKNQGEEVAVLVARDLDFSGVYRLR